MTWDWHRRVLKKYGVTKDCSSPEVSRISSNKARIDNASESNHTTLAFDPVLMVRKVMGIDEPWELSFFSMGLYREDDFRSRFLRGEVQVGLEAPQGRYPCPDCGALCRVHQRDDRYYSHLPICGMGLVIRARVPKLRCEACNGYPQMAVPWARPRVTYTKMLECYAFKLLCDMPVSGVADHTGVGMFVIWDMIRYRVDQALKRMDLSCVTMIYADETSAKKGHNYVTVISDQTKRTVYIREGKGSDTIDDFSEWLVRHGGHPDRIMCVSCDLGDAYPAGVRRNFPNAVIVYDRFHVVKLANEAMDEVVRRYMSEYTNLIGLRRKLMMNPSDLDSEESKRIMRLVDDYRPVSECYRLKNVLASIYDYGDAESASRVLDLWLEEARRTGEPSMDRLAKTIEARREGILAWFRYPVSNGFAEGLNSLIQTTKRVARGFRNIENFIAMIYLRNGRLDIRFDRAGMSVPIVNGAPGERSGPGAPL